mmetsp:Transcript_13298/g.26252  ORF Transcript_13298/g.26252 Transcript_13298/m.26252 type:complete len:227 (+) Transcript_13298:685-1365(+)
MPPAVTGDEAICVAVFATLDVLARRHGLSSGEPGVCGVLSDSTTLIPGAMKHPKEASIIGGSYGCHRVPFENSPPPKTLQEVAKEKGVLDNLADSVCVTVLVIHKKKMIREVLNLLPHKKPFVKEPAKYLETQVKAVRDHPAFRLLHVTVDGDSSLLVEVTANLYDFLLDKLKEVWFNDIPHSIKGLARAFEGGTSDLSFSPQLPLQPGLLWGSTINHRAVSRRII